MQLSLWIQSHKKTSIIIGVCTGVVIFIGIIAFKAFFAAGPSGTAPTTDTTSQPLYMFFQQEKDGQLLAIDGKVTVTGDCQLPNSQTSEVTRTGKAWCNETKANSSHTSNNDKNLYVIDTITFFNDNDQQIYQLPITGPNSLSPLRLTKDQHYLTTIFHADGSITVTPTTDLTIK